MNIKFLRTAFLAITLLFAATTFGQQVPNNKPNISHFLQDKQKIRVTNGSVFANFADQKVTMQEIFSNLNELLKLDENHTFEQISQREDEIGFIHTNFQVLYKGYAIDGHIIMFHEKDGLLKSINGNVVKLKDIDININIDDNQAISIAKEHLGVTKVFKENPVHTVFTQNPEDKKFYLTKKVRIESFSPLVRYDVFIDAETGEVLKKITLIPRADVQGTAHTLLSGVQTITCDSRPSGDYRLYDNARRIGTYNGATWNYYGGGGLFPSSNTIYTNPTTTWSNNPALDVHWGISKTYDYYMTTFSRNSYDGSGGEIYNIYNPALLDDEGFQFNAGALGYGIMVYGRGGTLYGYYQFNPFVAIDVTGHEFSHLVVEDNGNGGLYYQGESGALNESFADIFATCIEFYVGVNPNWLIGEDVVLHRPSIRSMENPKAEEQPDTYLGYYWADTNSSYDRGGVHINSGVQNYWFYLLCQGGSGINDLGNSYSVTGIGMAQAQRIAYRNLINYLNPIANHIDSYNGSLQAAADLFGNPSAQYTAVKQAWYAVGIDENTIPPPPPAGCRSMTYLTDASGTLDDGFGDENYADDLQCVWVIMPPNAKSITLTFTEFKTEQCCDYVYVVNGETGDMFGMYSGNSIPSPITMNSGVMVVIFNTDGSVNDTGWKANYTSSTSLSLDEIEDSKIAIFPNPAKNVINIQFEENQQNTIIEIYDIIGRLIQQHLFQNIQANGTQMLNIENIPNGIYNVKIMSDTKKTNHKLIISR